MKVATWNVNGIRARESQFVEWMREERPDVACLQEIKATPEQLSETLTLLPEYWSYWHGGPKGYSGVSLHFRKERYASRPTVFHPDFDMENRVACGEMASGVVVASVYVPNGGKDFAAKMRFLEGLQAFAAATQADGKRLVVCGDLNVARADIDVHPKERKPGAIGQRADERALFERILGLGMKDVARELSPADDTIFTWWPPWRSMRQKNQGWRIDYVLASGALVATGCQVRAQVGTSDHAPVVVTFDGV